jgi:hypothetical protein
MEGETYQCGCAFRENPSMGIIHANLILPVVPF